MNKCPDPAAPAAYVPVLAGATFPREETLLLAEGCENRILCIHPGAAEFSFPYIPYPELLALHELARVNIS